MHVYKSLYAITEWRPEKEPLSFVSDLRDMGVAEAFRAYEVHKAAQCPVYVLAGPEIPDRRTRKKEQAAWVL